MLQNPSRNLLPYGTGIDNVAFAQRAARGYRRAQLTAPRELLDRLGLGALGGQRVSRMSGGEQQRLSVAIGMAAAPGLLLADEPTSQLDRGNRDRVVGRQDLIDAVWGGRIVSESAVTTRINAVRRAVGDTGSAQTIIRTVIRKGVRFIAPVADQDGGSG